MTAETIIVDNVKCSGCVATIEQALGEMPGINEVQVDQPSGTVRIQGDDFSRQEICQKLAALGYPERAR
jgi:copper chaperone